ncbi:MAG TPA: PIN domain-containing protein [Solirubrobacterales bacterium]|nr:PIN domain-containing protein [Solirubrobacterales bacterium]
MKVLVDSAPLVAAANRRDSAHQFAAELMTRLRRDALIPVPVLAEVDHILAQRLGSFAARRFLRAVADGIYEVAYLSAGLMRRAVELDEQYADLGLGFADCTLMALAERHELPILTFDFTDFRATESASGPWRLAIDESTYAECAGSR